MLCVKCCILCVRWVPAASYRISHRANSFCSAATVRLLIRNRIASYEREVLEITLILLPLLELAKCARGRIIIKLPRLISTAFDTLASQSRVLLLRTIDR